MKLKLKVTMHVSAEHPGEEERAAQLNREIEQRLGSRRWGKRCAKLDKCLTNDFNAAWEKIGSIFDRADARLRRKR